MHCVISDAERGSGTHFRVTLHENQNLNLIDMRITGLTDDRLQKEIKSTTSW